MLKRTSYTLPNSNSGINFYTIEVRILNQTFINIVFILLALNLATCTEDKIDPEAAGHILGVVNDNTSGDSLPGVKITTNPATVSLESDEEGNFVLTNIGIGDYVVTAKKFGYRTESVTVAVNKDDTTKVSLLMNRNSEYNKPPEIRTNPTPVNNATGQPVEIILMWGATDPNPQDTLTYDVYIYETIGDEKKIEFVNLTDTILEIADLNFRTKYFWQVVVHDGYTTSYGPMWNFETLELPDNPFLFVRKVDDNYEIFSSDTTEKTLARLTYNNHLDLYPKLDPKRDKIAFISYEDLAPYLYTMNRDGSKIEKLSSLPVGAMFNNGIGLCWSNTGSYVYFSYYNMVYRTTRDGSILNVFCEAPGGRNFSEIEHSPDGSKFVVAAVKDKIYDTELYLISDDGLAITPLLDSLKGIMASPSFSIDSRKVLFTWDASENQSLTGRQLDARIYTLDLTTGQMTDLSVNKKSGTNDLHPAFSPNGAQIVFENISNSGLGGTSIYIMDSDGTDRRKVFSDAIMPDW